jgi:hypothetical protein
MFNKLHFDQALSPAITIYALWPKKYLSSCFRGLYCRLFGHLLQLDQRVVCCKHTSQTESSIGLQCVLTRAHLSMWSMSLHITSSGMPAALYC